MNILEHCKGQTPILDRSNKFMFFSNNKVAQTSINRHLLRSRAIVWKDDPDGYAQIFDENAESFDSLYKFTIVRNPWDRVVSAFFYLKGTLGYPGKLWKDLKLISFDQFVLKTLRPQGVKFNPHFDLQYPKAFFNGECFVDFIGRLENIKSDWKVIAKAISAPGDLPHKNKKSHKDYRKYYRTKTVNVIREIYARDIELLGYDFNGDVT